MSFWEMVVILVVALIVIKPERLPEMAYMIGTLCARVKNLMQAVSQKINA